MRAWSSVKGGTLDKSPAIAKAMAAVFDLGSTSVRHKDFRKRLNRREEDVEDGEEEEEGEEEGEVAVETVETEEVEVEVEEGKVEEEDKTSPPLSPLSSPSLPPPPPLSPSREVSVAVLNSPSMNPLSSSTVPLATSNASKAREGGNPNCTNDSIPGATAATMHCVRVASACCVAGAGAAGGGLFFNSTCCCCWYCFRRWTYCAPMLINNERGRRTHEPRAG